MSSNNQMSNIFLVNALVVAVQKRVPKTTVGMTAFLTFMYILQFIRLTNIVTLSPIYTILSKHSSVNETLKSFPLIRINCVQKGNST